MKKRIGWLAFAALLVLVATLPACTSYDDDYGYYDDGPNVTVGVAVYGGYYGGGYGGCCYGGGGVYIPSGGPGFGPRPTPY